MVTKDSIPLFFHYKCSTVIKMLRTTDLYDEVGTGYFGKRSKTHIYNKFNIFLYTSLDIKYN